MHEIFVQLILLLITIISVVGLIIVIYSRKSSQITSRLFLIVLLLVIFYLISHALHFLILRIPDVTVLDLSCHSFLLLIIVALTFFSMNFPKPDKSFNLTKIIILAPALILLVLLWKGDIVTESHSHIMKFEAHYSNLYPLFLTYYFALLLFSTISLSTKFKREIDESAKMQILFFLIGLVITNLATFIFGLLLPWILGFYYLIEVSPLAFLAGVIMFTTVAVGKYNMFPATFERVRNFSITKKIIFSALILVPIIILVIQIPLVRILFEFQTNLELSRFFLVSVIGGIIVSISLAFVIIKILSQPISALQAAANEVKDGNYEVEVDASSNDELGELGEAFNKMAKTLQKNKKDLSVKEKRINLLFNAFEHSQTAIAIVDEKFKVVETNSKFVSMFNVDTDTINDLNLASLRLMKPSVAEYFNFSQEMDGIKYYENELVFTDQTGNKKFLYISLTQTDLEKSGYYLLVILDITERKKLEEDLIQSEKFAALGKMAAVLAHEIKTPLTSIKMNADIIKESVELDENDEVSFKIIQREINRLNQLVKEVLLYSREIKLEITKTNIKDLCTEIRLQLEPVLKEKQIDYFENTDDIGFSFDRDKMKQVFHNLLENAIDSIERNGRIKLTVKENKEKDYVDIIIKDDGKGISDISKIFEPFFTTKANGTGLGLAISKRIIEAHNGSINILSAEQGNTIFKITLPSK